MDNESFLISLTQAIGGCVFPVHSRRHLQQAIKRVQTFGAFQHRSFKREKIELIIAPDLISSTRISILSSKSPLPRLKREVILLDSETKDEMIDGAGEYMTGAKSHFKNTIRITHLFSFHLQLFFVNRQSSNYDPLLGYR